MYQCFPLLSDPRAGRLAHSCHIPYSIFLIQLQVSPSQSSGSAAWAVCAVLHLLRDSSFQKRNGRDKWGGWVSKKPPKPSWDFNWNVQTLHTDRLYRCGLLHNFCCFNSFWEINFLSSWRNMLRKQDFGFLKNFLLTAFFLLLFPVDPFPYAAGKAL